MDNEELQKKVETLTTRLDTISKEFDNYKFKVNPDNIIGRDLDDQSKQVIQDIVKDNILDIWWDELLYWSASYDGDEAWQVTGGVVFIGGELILDSSVDFEGVFKDTNNKNVLVWDKDQRFRMNFSLSVSDAENDARLFVGKREVGGNELSHYGFHLDGTTLKGECGDKTTDTRSTVDLLTIAVDTNYEIEARLFVGRKIDFYVNDILYGTITDNVPETNNDATLDYNARIADISFTRTSTAGSFYSSFFEYIRKR